MPWLPPWLCVWCAMKLFQLVKINSHRPWSPSSSQTYLCSHPIKPRYCPFHQCVPECLLKNAAVRMSLKSVRWKESLTSSSSKMDTTENCSASHSSKKSSVPDSPVNRCMSSEKATSKGFAVCAETPSDVNVCVPRLPPLSVIACHHLTLLIAISARAGNTQTLVKLRPWLSVAAWS